jgi:hypothetical protein
MLSCSCVPPSTSQRIERSEAIEFFEALRRRENPLAFWSFDASNGQQRVKGYVSSINETLLDIEDDQNEMTFVIIADVEFVRLERDEAPHQLSNVAEDSDDFVLGFQAGKYGCCVMAKDLRDGRNDVDARPDETK